LQLRGQLERPHTYMARARRGCGSLSASAPTAVLQPTFSISASKAHPHPLSAPPATSHVRRALPAASAILRARPIPSCANLALTPMWSTAQHFPQSALPASRARFRQLLVCLYATSALPAPNVVQLHLSHRSSAAAPSTRMHPLPVAPALAQPVLGKLYPPLDRASA